MHSHKKWKDIVECGVDRILFEAELVFPKIIKTQATLATSDVNTECDERSVWSKQLYYLHMTGFLEN